MSIFDNIILDEFTILEGEQAEAYKKHKAEMKNKDFKSNNERLNNRKNAGRKYSNKFNYDDNIRDAESSLKAHKMMKKSNRDNLNDYIIAKDAANRNKRRHPNHECTFSTNYLYESSNIEII